MGSRQDNEINQEEKDESNCWKGGVEGLGVSLRLITIECECDRLGDVTRLI